MKTKHRVVLLAVFALAGSGLALCLALTMPAATPLPGDKTTIGDSTVAAAIEPSAAAEKPQSGSPSPATPVASTERPLPQPTPVPSSEATSKRISDAGSAQDPRPVSPAPNRLRDHNPRAENSLRHPAYQNAIRGQECLAPAPATEKFGEPQRPFESLATRALRAKHLGPGELHALVQPLLTPQLGSARAEAQSEPGPRGESGTAGISVVVRDRPAVLDEIDQAVAQLNSRPPQVAIEALVLRVRLDKAKAEGVKFEMLGHNKHLRSAGPSRLEGLKVAMLDGSVSRLLATLQLIGATEIAASGRVAATEGQVAYVSLGKETYHNVLRAEKGRPAPAISESTAQLRLRPAIYADGTVCMEIENMAAPSRQGAASGESKGRPATATVLVPDGATAILGGIVRQGEVPTAESKPASGWLSAILPKTKDEAKTDESYESIVLLTARVIETDAANPSRARDGMRWDARRAIAGQYLQAARGAAAASDRVKALQFVAASLEFNPLDRAATDFRDRLWIAESGHFARDERVTPASAVEEAIRPSIRIATLPESSRESAYDR